MVVSVVGALVAATCASLVAANELAQGLANIAGFSLVYDLCSARQPEMAVAKHLVESAGFRSKSRKDFDELYGARIERPCRAIVAFESEAPLVRRR